MELVGDCESDDDDDADDNKDAGDREERTADVQQLKTVESVPAVKRLMEELVEQMIRPEVRKGLAVATECKADNDDFDLVNPGDEEEDRVVAERAKLE